MFGHSCENFTDATANLLLTEGYEVWNTGISATDPAQYLQAAKWLIPKLKPDYVITHFFMGNDLFYFCREPQPYQPVLYETNAGNIYSCPEGVYVHSAEEAYALTLSSHQLPNQDTRWFNWLCAKTSVTTQIWHKLRNMGWIESQKPEGPWESYRDEVNKAHTTDICSFRQIQEIDDLAKENGAQHILMIIPDFTDIHVDPTMKIPDLSSFPYHIPPNLNSRDYHRDGHYIETGHQKNTETILNLIDKPLK